MIIRDDGKPTIVAELSGNHGGELNKMLSLIAAAKKAGCDAAKFQLYEPEDLCDPANNDLYEKCKVSREWLSPMFNLAHAAQITLFPSIFSLDPLFLLYDQFNCKIFKFASPESTRLPSERYSVLAKTINEMKCTLIVSTGAADYTDMLSLAPQIVLYCPPGHPAIVTDKEIAEFQRLKVGIFGFSDHSDDLKTPLAMIAAGAQVIEKHFKLDDNCVDAAFSFNPSQMETLCRIAHR